MQLKGVTKRGGEECKQTEKKNGVEEFGCIVANNKI